MSDSFRSILQLPAKATTPSNVNLLLVTDSTESIKAIADTLDGANIEFTYDIMALARPNEDLSQQKYNAVVYDHFSTGGNDINHCLVEKIQWWCHFYSHIPLILITDRLGDEQAVSLIQSGVNGYVLRHDLSQLPQILEKTLFDFFSKQTIAIQQQQSIKRLETEKQSWSEQEKIKEEHILNLEQSIKRLETEKQSWSEQEKIKEEHILNLEQSIKQLKTEKQSWLEQEKIKEEHISHLSHELKSPISSILGFARMLKEQYYGPLNQKQLQYAGGIVSSGEHLLALVKNYLDLVKIDANKQTLDLEKLAVGEICQAAVFIVEEKAKGKGLELILDLGKEIDFCIGDSLRLKQVLINLLTNAIKFTDRGSITLKVNLQQDLLYFAVIDTGTGISAKNINKLFTPFPQITSHHESTGLGLTLSRKLAQLHGGDITVTSELGKGSCFTLSIPQYQ